MERNPQILAVTGISSAGEAIAMKAVYFAWVREKIGKASEDISPPGHIQTVAQLIAWLSQRGDEYQDAFSTGTVRVAIDRAHVKHDAMIGKAAEIAFFPPMTGG